MVLRASFLWVLKNLVSADKDGKYNEGSGIADVSCQNLLKQLETAVVWDSYHFGNYYSDSNPDADFLWGDFTNSRESMIQATNAFQKDVQPTMFPMFSEFAALVIRRMNTMVGCCMTQKIKISCLNLQINIYS